MTALSQIPPPPKVTNPKAGASASIVPDDARVHQSSYPGVGRPAQWGRRETGCGWEARRVPAAAELSPKIGAQCVPRYSPGRFTLPIKRARAPVSILYTRRCREKCCPVWPEWCLAMGTESFPELWRSDDSFFFFQSARSTFEQVRHFPICVHEFLGGWGKWHFRNARILRNQCLCLGHAFRKIKVIWSLENCFHCCLGRDLEILACWGCRWVGSSECEFFCSAVSQLKSKVLSKINLV